MSTEFGIEWESSAFPYGEGESIYQFQDSKNDRFFSDYSMSHHLDRFPEEAWHLIRGLISERATTGNFVFFCSDENFTRFLDFNDGRCTFVSVANVSSFLPKNTFEKQERALLSLYHKDPSVGHEIPMNSRYFFPVDGAELNFTLLAMKQKGWISFSSASPAGNLMLTSGITIQEPGWRVIEKLVSFSGLESKQVFVAMSFAESTLEAYKSIAAAITETGFVPLRIDNKEHNNEISGEILYEIKRSRFVVADVTGNKSGVYFEAGFAVGLGIPVIWACKESEKTDMHFDTRQYSHVLWKTEEDLLEKLSKRIKGTILTTLR